jgi:hypothetical protein
VRHYQDKTETRTYKECVKQTCDICQVETLDPPGWDSGSYKVADTEIKMVCKVGFNYPEGGSSVNTSFDICPTCFINRVVPLFKKTFGIEPHKEDRDW